MAVIRRCFRKVVAFGSNKKDVYKRQEGSELVISINKNDTAPIFEVSDLGIVGDVKQILPKLADAIRKYKASKATN